MYDILKTAPKVIKSLEDNGLWDYILKDIDFTRLITNKKMEILTVYVHGYSGVCNKGNQIKYCNFAIGYKFCGPANKCDCARESVSKKVSTTKQNYTEDKNHDINEKRKKTNLEIYGVENIFQDVDKIKKANLEKYGVTNPNKITEVRTKIANTNKIRYGGASPSSSPEVLAKIVSTNQERRGTDYALQCPDVRQKMIDALLSNYGVKVPIHNKDIAKKIKETNLKKYGHENAAKNLNVIAKIRKSTTIGYFDNLVERLAIHKITPVGSFNRVKDHEDWLCETCLTNFKGTAFNGKIPRCPTCYPLHISGPQQEIANFIIGLLGPEEVIQNDRTTLVNLTDRRLSKEIDIWLPKYNLAIEYCGLRWHTEISGNRGRYYHNDKFEKCQEIGIQLLTIYSDEWQSNSSLIKSMIQARLGLNKKVHARKLKIQQVDKKTAKEFFQHTHIQGYVNSPYNYGLFDGSELLMCMSISKPRFSKKYSLEIIRLASARNVTVVGGASRLFKYVIDVLNPVSVISYCDQRYGIGKVYANMGFEKFGKPTIGYEYVKVLAANKRVNRMNFTRKKVGNTNGLSVRLYLFSIGYERVYDCGHQKYIWHRPKK